MPVFEMPLNDLRQYQGRNPRPSDLDSYWSISRTGSSRSCVPICDRCLALYAAHDDATYEIALHGEEDQHAWQDHQHRRRHEQVLARLRWIVRGLLKPTQTDRQWKALHSAQIDQRMEEVVPVRQEREDGHGGQRRLRERQQDMP